MLVLILLYIFSAHLATYIKGSRMKYKNGKSFQEFEGSTLDAWDEGDDDSHLSTSPSKQSHAGIANYEKNQNEEICRPVLEMVYSDDSQDRQPQASGFQEEARVSIATSLKQAMKLKISEKLGIFIFYI